MNPVEGREDPVEPRSGIEPPSEVWKTPILTDVLSRHDTGRTLLFPAQAINEDATLLLSAFLRISARYT